ncbi:MAG: bacillithiol biosynthesis cysteine-adding enzyme BshC [Theionarchaea archaeon]|nr:bacillithiol biosynthesis cysteine-adding enzyme BshC [Theionarchaea archaeon]MBU7037546.1 bacillithiol biosynthesis cysteine-adding enzyme BshC [Theionarchaea archaeon]
MLSLDPRLYLSGLPLDYFTNFCKVASYFSADYHTIMSKKSAISDEVISSIESYNREIGASSLVFENIARLQENSPVVTGQQPCLLTGPLFVVYKALTAVLLAEKHGTVPIFWNASEDDDAVEVNHIWVHNTKLEEISISLESGPFFTSDISPQEKTHVITMLRELTPPTEFREPVLDMISASSERFSQMFSQLLSTLCSEYGLIMVEPHLFYEHAIPLYEQLITHPLRATALVNEAGNHLEDMGYKRQVHKPAEMCSFFILERGHRHSVTFDGVFHVEDESFTTPEMLAYLYDHPGQVISSVISRPLVQDFLLSTAAYCAGPGEVSYFAQMKRVYEFFKVKEPAIVPRLGATLMEPKVRKVLEKYALEVSELREPEKVLKSIVKENIEEFFDVQKKEVFQIMGGIQEYITQVDESLKRTGAAMTNHILQDLKRLEDKTASALKKKNEIVLQQIMKASSNTFPNNALQERMLNIFQYIIRYDTVVEAIYESFRHAVPGEHLILPLGD